MGYTPYMVSAPRTCILLLPATAQEGGGQIGHSHYHNLTISHSHTFTLSNFHTITLSNSHTFTIFYTLTLSHSHTFTLSHLCTLTLSNFSYSEWNIYIYSDRNINNNPKRTLNLEQIINEDNWRKLPYFDLLSCPKIKNSKCFLNFFHQKFHLLYFSL